MQPKVNWDDLFSRLNEVYTMYGQNRQKAVLNNHKNKKEMICRKLGVVSESDIVRISKNFERNK